MPYYGSAFVYDNIPSGLYGLTIVSFDTEYIFTGGSKVELTTVKSPRAIRHKLLGAFPSEALQIQITAIFDQAISPAVFFEVKNWLFGQSGYKKLEIIDPELSGIYFNCIMTEPEDIVINGYNGMRFIAQCDAGGGWRKSKSYSFTGVTDAIHINNSGNNDYTYPIVRVTLATNGTGFSIKNKSDQNRAMTFTGLSGGETITVHTESGLLKSSLGINRISNFNKLFLRLVRGVNELEFSGEIANVEIEYQDFVRIGG